MLIHKLMNGYRAMGQTQGWVWTGRALSSSSQVKETDPHSTAWQHFTIYLLNRFQFLRTRVLFQTTLASQHPSGQLFAVYLCCMQVSSFQEKLPTQFFQGIHFLLDKGQIWQTNIVKAKTHHVFLIKNKTVPTFSPRAISNGLVSF